MSAGGDGTTVDAEASLKELRAETEQAWTQVKEKQQQLEQNRQPPRSALSDTHPPLVSILREKERRLRAEIEVAKESELQSLPSNKQAIEVSLLEDLQREVGQLREMLSLVESQRQELQAAIEQERQYHQQLVAVKEKLQGKCDSLDEEESPEDVVDTVAQELEAKINTARQTERTVMKKMGAFVSKHFPVPQPEQVAKIPKNLRSKQAKSSKEMLPLKDILLELMTKCVDSPSNPYMELTDRHWPAYIELLQRCNIILLHPDDDRRVKLVPFHL